MPQAVYDSAAEVARKEAMGLGRMFGVLTAAQVALVDNQVMQVAVVPPDDTVVGPYFSPPNSNIQEGKDVLRVHIFPLFNPPSRDVTHRSRQTYLHMICKYANEEQHRPCDVKPASPWCAFVDRPNFFRLAIGLAAWLPIATTALNNEGITTRPGNFFQIKHIFIPVRINHLDAAGVLRRRQILVVISPLDRTVDYLDSQTHVYKPVNEIMTRTFQLLDYFLTYDFLPYEWKFRMNGSAQGGPVGGPASNDAGDFVGANAMAIAFGYRINTFGTGPTRLMSNRRRRYGAELLHGRFMTLPTNSYYYPQIRRQTFRWRRITSGSTPFKPLSQNKRMILNQLSDRAKGKWGARNNNPSYENWTRKSHILRHCRANLPFYRGFNSRDTYRNMNFEEYRSWVEMRDAGLV